MKLLINFADKGYEKSRRTQQETAFMIGGFDAVVEYNFDHMDSDFKEKNKKILNEKRGAGYWLWKPYFILETLKRLGPNDILVYCDCAADFTTNIDFYIYNMIGSIILFELPDNPEYRWTKADIFSHFNCLDNKTVTHSQMINAAISIWKVNEDSIQFAEKWLESCQNYNLITDEPSITPNIDGFIENRHDQSLLSVTAKLYRDQYAIQFMNDAFYKILINHHRNRE